MLCQKSCSSFLASAIHLAVRPTIFLLLYLLLLANKEFESAYLARARIHMAGGSAPLERPMGPVARGMEVYNELDDDED
jgi:hypothetical protein